VERNLSVVSVARSDCPLCANSGHRRSSIQVSPERHKLSVAPNNLIQRNNHIHHSCEALFQEEMTGAPMINRETGLPANPLAEMAVKAIADWVSIYRSAIGSKNESGACEPDEVKRAAKEIEVTSNQFNELAGKGPGNANLLKRMLVALDVDPKVIADMDPLVMRELKWLCITCSDKKRCKRELAHGTAREHFHEFCPNAVSLDELMDEMKQSSSH
jgi:hypothetical protein